MQVVPSAIPEVLIVEPDVHRDNRGFFLESYHCAKFQALGIVGSFVQDNHSKSRARTLRGLHLQLDEPQAKLVRTISGEVLDVAVDVRRGSPTFGRWIGVRLSADNFRQCYIPAGFAHGFYVLSASAEVEYKCSAPYNPSGEIGIVWNDPQIAIEWPDPEPILSGRDAALPRLSDIFERLPRF